jgi:hypothetical protein
MDAELRPQLLARREEDQRVRHLIAPPRDGRPVPVPRGIAEDWQAVDAANTAWLARVVRGAAPVRGRGPGRLDERCAAAGLDPIAEYAARLREHR